MHTAYHLLRCRAQGQAISVVRYGNWGPPLIYVPSSGGDHTEFGRYGMLAACAAGIHAGRFQVFSIDGHGPRTLFSDALTPPDRIAAYVRFERSVVERVLPWVIEVAKNPDLRVVGSSYGAFVAANLLFKHADHVRAACGLGGVYGLWHRLDGYRDADVYDHTPLDYLPRLEDVTLLNRIRTTRGLTLYAAEDDPWLSSSERMIRVLAEKSLPHHVEIWPSPADHHERWWRRQLPRFLEREFG